MNETLKIKRINPAAELPAYATPGSAAMDLRACLSEPVSLKPMERKIIPTGLALELPSAGYVALVFARSGLATKKGIALSNSVGVIDSDYRGEVGVGVINLSDAEYVIENGERIAQLAVVPVCHMAVEEAHTIGETERGAGGFGSTGVK